LKETTMSLKLYYGSGACSFVPHVLLQASGAAFEPVMVKLHKGEQQSEEYKKMNPRGQVPVLVDGDAVITQIVAICSYLADKFPEAGFLPTAPLPRAKAMETFAWMNNTIHPTFTHIFMPGKFTPNAAVHDDLRSTAKEQFKGHLTELETLVAAKNARGDAYLLGSKLSPLDPYVLTFLRWGSIAGINPQDYPATWGYAQQLADQPAFAAVIERERLQLNLYKPAA
jgi:glutathione S-transferase